MNAPSIDIKDILDGESSLGLTYKTDLFVGNEPGNPDNCVTIFDTPGFPSQLTFEKGEDYFYPSIQMRVRNKSYTTGWALANDIKEFLHGTSKQTINGTFYEVIISNGDPSLLDFDESDNARFVIGFDLQRRTP